MNDGEFLLYKQKILEIEYDLTTDVFSSNIRYKTSHGENVSLGVCIIHTVLNTSSDFKWHKHSIVQSNDGKVPTTVFCFLKIQSLFPEIISVVVVAGLMFVNGTKDTLKDSEFLGPVYKHETGDDKDTHYFFRLIVHGYISRRNVFSLGLESLELRKYYLSFVRTENKVSRGPSGKKFWYNLSYVYTGDEISFYDIESSDELYLCRNFFIRPRLF